MYEEEEYGRTESVADTNARIISLLDLPKHLMEEMTENRRERKKIELVEAHAKRCREATDGMLAMLNDFSSKIKYLESIMMPVHDATFQLTTAQQRIDTLIKEVALIKEHHDIANETEASVARRRLRHTSTDYQEYLDWVTSLLAAISFWSRHSDYKGADKMLRKLKDWSKKALAACEDEFTTHLTAYSDAIDFSRFPWPLPASFETVPKEVSDRMAHIAQIIDLSGSRSFLDAMVTHRGTALRNTIKRLLASKTSAGYDLKVDSNKLLSGGLSEASDLAGGSPKAATDPAREVLKSHLTAAATNALLNLGSGGTARPAGMTSALGTVGGGASMLGHPNPVSPSGAGGSRLGSPIVSTRGSTGGSTGGAANLRASFGAGSKEGNIPQNAAAAPAAAHAGGSVLSGHPLAAFASRLGPEMSTTMAGTSELAAAAAVEAQTQANIEALLNRGGAASRIVGGVRFSGDQDKGRQRSEVGARGRYLLEVFLRLLEAEFTFWTRAVHLTSVSQYDLSCKFCEMVTEAFDTFIMALQEAVAERSPSRAFYLLDMLDDCQRFSPRYRALLDAGELGHFGKYEAFRLQIHSQLKSALADYRQSVLQAGKSTNVSRVGSTCAFTVDTLLGLRRLAKYANAVNSLPETTIVDDPKLLQSIKSIQATAGPTRSTIDGGVGASVGGVQRGLILDHVDASAGAAGLVDNDDDDIDADDNDDDDEDDDDLTNKGARSRRKESRRSEGRGDDQGEGKYGRGGDGHSSFRATGSGWTAESKRSNDGICLLADSILVCVEQSLANQAKNMTKWPSLAPLFLLNNHFHMYKTVVKTQLPASPGWITHCSHAIAQYRDNYRHATWDEAIQSLVLQDEATLAEKGKLVSYARKRLAKFDEYFTENYSVQRRFVVPDDEMRAQIRAMNIETIVPIYKSFYERFANVDGFEFKFRPEVIETMLNRFFDETN